MLCLPIVCRSSLPLFPVQTACRHFNLTAVRHSDTETKIKLKVLQRKRRMLLGLRKQLAQRRMKIEKKLANAEKNIQKWKSELKNWRERNVDTHRTKESE